MKQTQKLRGCFITGTDTGVGKTLVAAALLHALGNLGVRAAGLKPVAAGVDLHTQINEDVALLQASSPVKLSAQEVCAYSLRSTCAPHIAASLEGVSIDAQRITDSVRAAAERADFLVLEGVGGFCVPLNESYDTVDMARDLGLPVVLVVGVRLGCLNHSVLSAQAITQSGLKLLGWVANTITPDMPYLQENLHTLRQLLSPAPCLGILPYFTAAQPATAAACLQADVLQALLSH